MRRLGVLAVILSALVCALPASAGMTKCKLTYNLEGWAFFYKQYSGTGKVTCSNGQVARVQLTTRGGGFAFGRSKIDDGTGTFSQVADISEVFGTYASAEAGAGASSAAEGYAMTKGEVSLSLSGVGRGVNVGVSFSGFTIARR